MRTMSGKTLDEEIQRIAAEALSSEELEAKFKEHIVNAFEDAFKDAFRWGKTKDAVKNRLEEILVPYIENYDMSAYVVKLDAILTQLAKETVVADNKKILENFKYLVGRPLSQTITLNELFREYAKHVESHADIMYLEVDFDGEPTYESIHIEANVVEERTKRLSFGRTSFTTAMLHFTADGQEDLNFSVELTHWNRDDYWTIKAPRNMNISSLRSMDSFEVLLLSLDQTFAQLTFEEGYEEDWITPEKRPEPIWS